MTKFQPGLIIGIFLGFYLGLFLTSLLLIAKKSDERGGYQPNHGKLDISNPPKGGSGIPNKEHYQDRFGYNSEAEKERTESLARDKY